MVQTQVLPLSIPADLISPCAAPALQGDTVQAVVNLAIDQDATLACYQAKQSSVRQYLDKQKSYTQ